MKFVCSVIKSEIMNIADFIKENEDLDVKKFNRADMCAIYFICGKDGQIVYIGSTTSLVLRILDHTLRKVFKGKDVFYFSIDKNEYKECEKKLIYEIKPQYNVVGKEKTKPKKNVPIIKREIAIKIRKNVVSIMAKRKISINELASIVGIGYQSMEQLLTVPSCMRARTVKKLAKALGVDPRDLIV